MSNREESPPQLADSRILIVSPHPDDEIIGAGSRLPRLSGATVIQVTDGSPRDLRDARANGFATREDYAAARRDELRAALALAGEFETIHLDLPDQEASFHLVELTHVFAELFTRLDPEIILTIPYEGGHPDHDATAFAVQNALDLSGSAARIMEMTAYHNGPHGCSYNEFLNPTANESVFHLTASERALKQRMFDCFKTQFHVLQWFPIGIEKFRFAPRYDFTIPPHPGALYYELFPWGVSGEEWRTLAGEALQSLHSSRQRLGLRQSSAAFPFYSKIAPRYRLTAAATVFLKVP
jgi:N-acetylglucosamine malate deacetylase 2